MTEVTEVLSLSLAFCTWRATGVHGRCDGLFESSSTGVSPGIFCPSAALSPTFEGRIFGNCVSDSMMPQYIIIYHKALNVSAVIVLHPQGSARGRVHSSSLALQSFLLMFGEQAAWLPKWEGRRIGHFAFHRASQAFTTSLDANIIEYIQMISNDTSLDTNGIRW